MKRRTFLIASAGAIALPLLPSATSAKPSPFWSWWVRDTGGAGPMQYGATLRFLWNHDHMHARTLLDGIAEEAAAQHGKRILTREYLYLPWNERVYEYADLAHTDSYSGIKWWM